MEVQGAEKRKGTVFFYEMLGTALFIYGIMLTYSAASIAFSLAASILIFGSVTGGHFNPAVTLGVYISEGKYKENLSWVSLIWLAQFLGGFLAMGLTECTLFGEKFGSIPAGDV